MNFFRRLRELDARVTDAREKAAQAAEEAEFSRQRRREINEDVVEPLEHSASHNQFAEMIRATILQGHPNRKLRESNGT